ncbi:MAG: zinc ABC transporter substrate-binding protein [Weeksellaceae bacterium]|nr:zinc ABC transporter substrate-binding protein [Weeksellaceae bacterium]
MRFCGWFLGLATLATFVACKEIGGHDDFRVVTTTTMLTDLAENIGGDSIKVIGLMQPGIDPHSFKPPESSVLTLGTSDVILYHGLHLEGRMNFIFEKMHSSNRYHAFAVAERIEPGKLMQSENFPGMYDPHIWFSIDLWKEMALEVCEILVEEKPLAKTYFEKNTKDYISRLDELKEWSTLRMNDLPENRRYLVTAHDAFGYFGREWNMEVIGIQGISTNSEAGFGNLLKLADFIQERRIPVVFSEISVSDKSVMALQQAVRNAGGELRLGESLYSDALGGKNSGANTYIGMYKHNVETIVNALR